MRWWREEGTGGESRIRRGGVTLTGLADTNFRDPLVVSYLRAINKNERVRLNRVIIAEI